MAQIVINFEKGRSFMRMKRRLFTFLLAITMAVSCAQIPSIAASAASPGGEAIESAFTDAAFLEEVRKIVGKTNGEHIYPSDVEGITTLEVINNYIESLDGIEYFTALKKLYCYFNDIQTLDLSHNTSLEVLDCSFNTTLVSVDVSNCPALEVLECNYTGLEQLDVTNNPNLTRLICFSTRLKALDISNNVLLEELDVYDACLASLDVSKNDKLIFLDCSWNHMCSIKSLTGLENCTALPADAFCFEPQDSDIEHCWDNGKVTVKPTCTEAGETTYICTSCGQSKTEEIAATGHTPGKWEIAAFATTKREGLRVKKCTVCHAELERETIPKLTPNPPSPPAPGPAEPDPSDDDPANCSKDENCPLAKFADISMNAWYHDSVHFCTERKLMSGYGNNKFAPNAVLTRGMLAQILYNLAERPAVTGNSPFDDVAPDTWYAKAIAWASENGFFTGYSGGRFGPEDPITRQQLATILWRYDGSPESTESLDSFHDGKSASAYAFPALAWAAEQKIVNGKGGGVLDPKGGATRAEVASMLQRYLTLEG